MRNRALFYGVLFIIVAGCLILGCLFLPLFGQPPQKTPVPTVDIGFASGTAGNMSGEVLLYSFDEAIANLEKIDVTNGTKFSAHETGNISILYIQGTDLDTDANAKNWVFAVRLENTTSFVTYDRNGMNRVNWPAGFSGKEIRIDQIILPGVLFDRNRELISKMSPAKSTLSRQLVLESGNYTLTISGQGSPRVLVFDATTGALISSNE